MHWSSEGSGEPTLLECNYIFVRARRTQQWLEMVEALDHFNAGLSLACALIRR
jgi:hypothetical protein